MLIVRYTSPESHGVPAVGVTTERGLHPVRIAAMSDLLRLPLDDIRAIVEAAAATEPLSSPHRLLPPVDGVTEVWAAGVTYRDSRDARVEESERASTVYTQVYSADRPELFFKSASWRTRGDGDVVCVRQDGGVSVPEPELAVVGNARAEIVGYTICNDVSSRSIEAANPLYLPQAKIYDGACAVGPGVRPAWELQDPYALRISAAIERAAQTVWSAATSSGMLHRRIDELIGWLTRATTFPEGFVLSTGTGIVPDWPISIAPGDTVTVEIEGIGTLANLVATS